MHYIRRHQRIPIVVISLTLAAGCGGSGSGGATASTTSAPATTAQPTALPTTEVQSNTTMANTAAIRSTLASIALTQSEPPTGTEFFKEEGDSALTQPVQDSPREIKQTVGEGAIATLYRIFFTPEMLDALYAGPAAMDEYSVNFDTSGHWSVGSWVTAYDRPEAASSALALIFEEFTTRWQLTKLDDPGLGNEGAIFEGTPPQATGVPTTIYFWRSGSYLLQVGAHGSVEADADEIRAIAEAMESRVPSS